MSTNKKHNIDTPDASLRIRIYVWWISILTPYVSSNIYGQAKNGQKLQ